MISFFGRLWRDRRGNALAIACAAMPMVVACAGLATDTIQWTLWKRQLQRAADSAAISGVYDRENASGATTNTSTAVCRDLALNLHTWMSLQGSTPCTGSAGSYSTLTYPADTTYQTNQVSVTLKIQQPLPFSSLFMSSAPLITASATAASIAASGDACIEALETGSTTTGISNSGNTTINAPTCILFSNSPASNSASANGSASVTAKAIAAVGGIAMSSNWIVDKYIPYSPPLPDPFASVTPDPTQMHCIGATLDDGTDWTKLGTTNCFGAISLKPGRTINVPNNFGPIYVNGGSVDLKGTFNCTGCTIVMTNTSAASNATIGSWTSNASANNNISAPTSGTYKGIAVYQDRRATGNTDKINGGSSNVIQGAVYFPKDILQINGSGNSVSLCSMFIAKDIVFTGNSSIAISSPDDTACSGSGMPSNSATKMVRLVA